MNLFEKIFNYQILSRLENTGTFMVTTQERRWLKTMLQHPAADAAFTLETLQKLTLMLEQEQAIEMQDQLIHKAASKEKDVYHSFLRPLRLAIINKRIVFLSYSIKNGDAYAEQEALPYKLEYSMVKREWYLLWYHVRNRTMMSTKLQKIRSVREEDCSTEKYTLLLGKVNALLNQQKMSVDILVVKAYNGELSRILYAFSCFEKEVIYSADRDEYTIRLHFPGNEKEYVLSKTRFLGKRVQIVHNNMMKRRMLESATKALERYEL